MFILAVHLLNSTAFVVLGGTGMWTFECLLCLLNFALINLVFFQMPQHDSKDKKMKFFNSGTVAMDVNLERTGFFQGENP